MTNPTRILMALILSSSLKCFAQTPRPFEASRAEAAFEELPVLNASEILRPEFLQRRLAERGDSNSKKV